MIEKTSQDDGRTPFEKMADLAARIVSTPKAEVDRREKEWKSQRIKQDKAHARSLKNDAVEP